MRLEDRLAARLLSRSRRAIRIPGLRRAAVLLPLIERPGGRQILFIERRPDAPTHAGQVAFPGGGREPDDADDVATALRETWEEVGIPADAVEVLGQLDDLPTATSRYIITPVVGAVEAPDLTLNPSEVARTIELPVQALLDAERWETRPWGVGPIKVPIYYFRYSDELVWGATAAILHQFKQVLAEVGPDRR